MTESTEDEIVGAKTGPRCIVDECRDSARVTLFGRLGNPLGTVCTAHAHELAEPGTFEPDTTLDWATFTVRQGPGALEGWFYIQQLESAPVLYGPTSKVGAMLNEYARWTER